jgi:hypothetical protein
MPVLPGSSDLDQPKEQHAPIIYRSLLPCRLHQVHEILARKFWAGIDGTFIRQSMSQGQLLMSNQSPLHFNTAWKNSDLQTPRSWRCHYQLSAGNVHCISGCQGWFVIFVSLCALLIVEFVALTVDPCCIISFNSTRIKMSHYTYLPIIQLWYVAPSPRFRFPYVYSFFYI